MLEKKAIRVLAVYPSSLGRTRGTPLRVRNILQRMARDTRFIVTVASTDEALPFDTEHVKLPVTRLEAMKLLRSVVKTGNVDLVIGHTMTSWSYLAFLKLSTKVKVVLEMHGFLEEEAFFNGDIGTIQRAAKKLLYGIFYRMCDGITTCGGLGTQILKRYNKNVVPVIGGVDVELFRPDGDSGGYIRREPHEVVIGYAGNLRKWQGVPFLIEAFKKLHAIDPNFVLAILASERFTLQVNSGMQLVDRLPYEQVPAFLSDCDILVIPRLIDRVSKLGPPSKLLEYMAMGKAVVVSAVGSMDEILVDSQTGRVFAPGDEKEFIKILLELRDSKLRERLGAATVDLIRTRYTWDREYDHFASFITAVATK